MADVMWPGDTSDVPSDRSIESSTGAAVIVAVFLSGIVLSLIVGRFGQELTGAMVPASGITILIGIAFGGVLHGIGDSEITALATFNERLFLLVFLPIIIF